MKTINRCCICKGREVEGENNLLKTYEGYVCKDTNECNRNILSEATMIDFVIDDSGKIQLKNISRFGTNLLTIQDEN